MKVPIVGGEWDGAFALLDDMTPGRRLTLDGSTPGGAYEVAWVEGSPRLVPVTCEP